MKNFFAKYSYTVFKLFLNQFAIALFGVALFSACSRTENKTLVLITGIMSILFYLFLQYAVMWEVGAKDGITAAARNTSRGLWRGVVISLLANVLNLLLALVIAIGAFAVQGGKLHGIASVCKVISLFLQGMYMGVLSMDVGGTMLKVHVWPYFAIVLPAVLICTVAYVIGSYGLHFTNILIPKNKDVKNNGRPE